MIKLDIFVIFVCSIKKLKKENVFVKKKTVNQVLPRNVAAFVGSDLTNIIQLPRKNTFQPYFYKKFNFEKIQQKFKI